MNSPQNRIPAFDTLRIIACILVVLIHVSAQWTDSAATQGTAALAFSLGCNMFAFASLPLFIMISGALYLPSRGASPRRMFRRSAHFVILYFIWKLFYLLEDCVMEPELLAQEGFKKHVILALFQTEGKYHLWYLPMLAVLLFLTPLICDGVQKKSVRSMYLILFFLLAILLPTAFQFEFPFKYLLMDFRNLFDLSYFVGYLGFFIFGYHLYESNGDGSLRTHLWNQQNTITSYSLTETASFKTTPPDQKTTRRTTAIIAVISAAAILTWALGLFHAVRRTLANGAVFYGLSTPFALHSLLLAVSIFLLAISGTASANTMNQIAGSAHARQEPARSSSAERKDVTNPAHSSRIRQTLSASTFGIYLIHPFILDLLTKAGFLSILRSPFYGIPVLLTVTFGLSFLLTEILLHIPLFKRLVK